MGRSRRDWTQDKFERYRKEGRGQGSGSNYQPWIKRCASALDAVRR